MKREKVKKADHIRRPPELTGNKDARRIGDTVRDDDLLDFVAQGVFDRRAQFGKFGCFSLTSLLLFFRLLEFKALFGYAH